MRSILCLVAVLFLATDSVAQSQLNNGVYSGPGTAVRVARDSGIGSWVAAEVVVNDSQIVVRQSSGRLLARFDTRTVAGYWDKDIHTSRDKGMFALGFLSAAGAYFAGQYYIKTEKDNVERLRSDCISSLSPALSIYERMDQCHREYPEYNDGTANLVFYGLALATGGIIARGSKKKTEHPYYVLREAVEGARTVHIKLGNDSRFRPKSNNGESESRLSVLAHPQQVGLRINF